MNQPLFRTLIAVQMITVLSQFGLTETETESHRLIVNQHEQQDHQYATLQEAIAASRQLPEDATIKIIVQPGRYFLNETIVLNEQDSILTIEGSGDTKPEFIGGRIITDWQKDGENFYSAKVPGVKSGEWDFRALVVNGELRMRARMPEEDRFEHLSEFDIPWMSTTGGGWKREPTQEELTTLKYKPEQISDDFDVNNAEITVYHMWDESMVGVESIDRENHVIHFSNPGGHPAGAFGVQEYVIWNTREGMTQPGQWYLDRTHEKVVYLPLPNENMESAEVIAPVLETVFDIRNTKDITLKNLNVSVTTTPLIAGGFGAGRFAGAINLNDTENISLQYLEVYNVAGQGIRVEGSEDTVIEQCHVYSTGACGIKAPSSVVKNSHIHHIGKLYPSAIGLWGGGKGCVFSHNEIHHTPYSAINCGGEDHEISHNRIYQAMLELHDGGAIYVFAGKNTVMNHNYAYDIPDTGGYGSSAYYLDERSTDCAIEYNVSVGIERPTHNHMANNNVIRNNVFIYDGDMRLTFPKSSGYEFSKNILVADGDINFQKGNAVDVWENNIIYSGTGKLINHILEDYETQETVDLSLPEDNSTINPQISVDDGKVIYENKGLIEKLNIETIDVSNAGRDK